MGKGSPKCQKRQKLPKILNLFKMLKKLWKAITLPTNGILERFSKRIHFIFAWLQFSINIRVRQTNFENFAFLKNLKNFEKFFQNSKFASLTPYGWSGTFPQKTKSVRLQKLVK